MTKMHQGDSNKIEKVAVMTWKMNNRDTTLYFNSFKQPRRMMCRHNILPCK